MIDYEDYLFDFLVKSFGDQVDFLEKSRSELIKAREHLVKEVHEYECKISKIEYLLNTMYKPTETETNEGK